MKPDFISSLSAIQRETDLGKLMGGFCALFESIETMDTIETRAAYGSVLLAAKTHPTIITPLVAEHLLNAFERKLDSWMRVFRRDHDFADKVASLKGARSKIYVTAS
jgi:hypothetical protein